jgi:hypothetical protein
MNRPSGICHQNRIGYLIFDGEDKELPVLTERLRHVPLDHWSIPDVGNELEQQVELARQIVKQAAQCANEQTWLCAVVRPLAEQYPDAPTSQLVKLLPEPDRSRAEAIMDANATVPWDALPIEQVNRQPWHRDIEEAIFRPHKGAFTVDDILRAAGIAKNATERPAAAAYAWSIMHALSSYPATANVALPVMMPQQSDKLQ